MNLHRSSSPARRSTQRTILLRAALVALLAVPLSLAAPIGPAGADPTVPGTPTAVVGSPGNGAASVRWQPPASDGGSVITGYVVTPVIGFTPLTSRARSLAATARSTFFLFPNGTVVKFRVQAVNAVGTGAYAVASAVTVGTPAAVTSVYTEPTIGHTPAGLPDRLIVTPANHPAENGAAITAWQATCTSPDGGATGWATLTGSYAGTPAVIVAGVTAGKRYRCSLATINSRGTSVAVLGPATIVGTPRPPEVISVTVRAPGQLRLSAYKANVWCDCPVDIYVATCISLDGGVKVSTLGQFVTFVNGVTVGKTYRCTLAAHNMWGTGHASTFPDIVA